MFLGLTLLRFWSVQSPANVLNYGACFHPGPRRLPPGMKAEGGGVHLAVEVARVTLWMGVGRLSRGL